jgi:signal transduction histidine kinase
MLRQAPLLLILLAGILYWLQNHLEGALYDSNLKVARDSAALAASAVQITMQSEETHRSWARIEQLLPPDEDTSIEIVNLEGRVLYATDPAARGLTRRLTDESCAHCHVGGAKEADASSKFIAEPGGAAHQVYAAPLLNSEDCRGCHQTDPPKLGMVYVKKSIAPLSRLIRSTQIGLIIAGIVSMVLTVSLTRLLLGRYLGRPLNRLVRLADDIGSVTSETPKVLPDSKELAALARTLYASAEELRESLLQIRGQRDSLETLYGIADHLSRTIRPDVRCRRAVELASMVFGTDCVLVAGHFHPESGAFHGTVTFRESGGPIVEQPYPCEDVRSAAPYYRSSIVEWWLTGKLDESSRIRTGGTVGYPLRRRQRRLGLILAPVRGGEETEDGRATAAHPEVVQALRKHLAIALELSELQRRQLERERLAAIGETVAGLSHCLKNTLNGLQGGQYVVQRALDNDDPVKLKQGWRILTDGVRHIERLTLDMLFFAGEHSFHREPTDPNRILEEVAELLSQSAEDRGVRIRTELDESMVRVPIEGHAVYRAVLNLVTNAIDACVDSETGDTVVLRSRLDPDQIVLSVEDDGVGIPPAMLRRVTERFFTTKSAQGTGLGLPVVKKIAEEHGGALEVESRLGHGSTFHLRIPRSIEALLEQDEPSEEG